MLNSDESVSEKLVNKGFWIYLFVILTSPISYAIRIVLSHDLSLSDFGLFYGIISFMSLLSTYSDFGMTESLNYFIPKFIVHNDYGRSKILFLLAFGSQIVMSLVIGGTIFSLSPWLAENYFHDPHALIPLQIMCLFFIGLNMMHIGTAFFTISQNTKYGKGIEFFRMLLTLVGIFFISFLGVGTLVNFTWAWIGALFIGASIAGIISFWKYYRVYFLRTPVIYDRAVLRNFFKYSFATLLTANIAVMLGQIDMQLIIYFLGQDQVSPGYYSNYLSLISAPFLIFSPIIGFLFPVISELSSRQNYESIRMIWRAFAKYLTICALWVSIFFVLFGTEFSLMFFGEKYRVSGEILAYSAPFMVFNFLIQLNFQILAGVGRIRERAKILAITLVINLALNLFFILALKMGVRGSALAVGLSWIPLWYMSHRAVHEFTVGLDWKKLILNAIIAIPTLSIIYLVTHDIYIGSMTFGNSIHFSESIRIESFVIILIAIFGSFVIFWLANRDLFTEARTLLRNVRKKKKAGESKPLIE